MNHAPHMRCGLTLSLATAFSLLWIGKAVGSDAVLRGTVCDGITGHQTPCTVTITDANGTVAVESDSFRNGFRCSGEFTRSLPAGPTRIQITRGLETKAINRQVNLVAGETTDLAFTLERVVNLRNRGWFGGDSHVHMLHGERTVPVSFDYVALAARAEDLQFLCLAQAWNLDQPTPERLEAELRGRSTPDCVLTWNLEAPKNYYKGDAGRCLGHCWNLGVRGRTPAGQDVIRLLMEASAWDYESTKPTYANFESHQLIHDQAGVACYSHPARWWMGPWGGQGGYPKVDRHARLQSGGRTPFGHTVGAHLRRPRSNNRAGRVRGQRKGVRDLVPIAESRVSDRGDRVLQCLLRSAWRRRAGPAAHLRAGPRQILSCQGDQSDRSGKDFRDYRAFVDRFPQRETSRKPVSLRSKCSCALHRSLGFRPLVGRTSTPRILRNGKTWREFTLEAKPSFFQTNLNFVELETSWYCVRVFGPDRQTAISGAFYFANDSYRPAKPMAAQVFAQVLDAKTGVRLPSVLTEVTFSGTIPRDGKRHRLPTGEARIPVAGTARLRAEAKGYAPLTLSPFLDNPPMVRTVTSLGDDDLCNWQTFEELKRQLQDVRLVYRLQRARQ